MNQRYLNQKKKETEGIYESQILNLTDVSQLKDLKVRFIIPKLILVD